MSDERAFAISMVNRYTHLPYMNAEVIEYLQLRYIKKRRARDRRRFATDGWMRNSRRDASTMATMPTRRADALRGLFDDGDGDADAAAHARMR